MKNLFKNIMNSVLSSKEEPSPAPAPSGKTEGHKVSGTSYRQDDIKKLGTKNQLYNLEKADILKKGMYNQYIYDLTFSPASAALVPEPDNPHDPKAIKVLVDGVHVGYIKAGSCSHVKNLIDSGSIAYISSEIYGGNYKYVAYDQYEKKSEMSSGQKEFGVKITISLKK